MQDFQRRSSRGSFSTRANAALSVGTGTVGENNCGTESQVHLVTPGLSATVRESSWKSSPTKIHIQGRLTVVGNSAAQGRPDLEKAAVGEATVTGNGSDCKYALGTSQVEMTTCARPRVRCGYVDDQLCDGYREDIKWYYSLLRTRFKVKESQRLSPENETDHLGVTMFTTPVQVAETKAERVVLGRLPLRGSSMRLVWDRRPSMAWGFTIDPESGRRYATRAGIQACYLSCHHPWLPAYLDP